MNLAGGIQSVGKWMVIVLSGIMIALLLAQSLVGEAVLDCSEHSYFIRGNLVVKFAILAMAALCIVIARRRKPRFVPGRHTLFAITAAYGLLLVVLVMGLQVSPRADQINVLAAASQLMDHDYSVWKERGYLYIYPYQRALVLLHYGTMKVFGRNNGLAIQLMNIPLLMITAASLADLVRGLFKSRALGAYAYIGLLAFFPMAFYTTFVYGNVVGLAFSSVGLNLIVRGIEKNRFLTGALGGLLLALAATIRTSYLVFAIAASIVLLFAALGKRRIKPIFVIVVLIAGYLVGGVAVTKTIEQMTGETVNEGVPTIAWIAMGLQESSYAPGWYNAFNRDTYVEAEYDEEKAREVSREAIKQSLADFAADKSMALAFFARKTASQWNNGTFQGLWIQQRRGFYWKPAYWAQKLVNDGGVINRALTQTANAILPLLWLGVLFFLACGAKEQSITSLILMIAFIGGFLLSLIWEGKGQYTVSYAFILIPISIRGYQLAIRMPKRAMLRTGVPLTAVTFCLVLLCATTGLGAIREGDAEAYDRYLWTYSGGDLADGSYLIQSADGGMTLAHGENNELILVSGDGDKFTFDDGLFTTSGGTLALNAHNATSKAGTNVNLYQTIPGGYSEQWYCRAVGDGKYQILYRGGFALNYDQDTGEFSLEKATDADNQTWFITSVEDRL